LPARIQVHLGNDVRVRRQAHPRAGGRSHAAARRRARRAPVAALQRSGRRHATLVRPAAARIRRGLTAFVARARRRVALAAPDVASRRGPRLKRLRAHASWQPGPCPEASRPLAGVRRLRFFLSRRARCAETDVRGELRLGRCVTIVASRAGTSVSPTCGIGAPRVLTVGAAAFAAGPRPHLEPIWKESAADASTWHRPCNLCSRNRMRRPRPMKGK
jgi:hypothetical protein